MKMKFKCLAILLASSHVVSSTLSAQDRAAAHQIELMDKKAFHATLALLDADVAHAKSRGIEPTCTRDKLEYRPEFGSMAKRDRKAYTTAIRCLQNKTKNTPTSNSTGARSRFDDFILTHYFQTPYVHVSGTFLGWHRWYVYMYQQALKSECGYRGPAPYVDWSKWGLAPQDSPIFNGDEYSLGGNGEYIANHTTPAEFLPPGLGGGCVKSGPFKDYVVNIGPRVLPNPGPEDGLGYNPRCLKRDVGPAVALKYTNYTAVLDVMKLQTIARFQDDMQGKNRSNGEIGIHGGGHYIVSGDPGGDFYVSPGDPFFYIHHGQIDRLWAIWQAQAFSSRLYALAGTNTMDNIPPSENTTLDFRIDIGYADLLYPKPESRVTMESVMSTIRGPFCYIYV